MSLFTDLFKSRSDNSLATNDGQSLPTNSLPEVNIPDSGSTDTGFVNDSEPGITVKTSTFGTGHPIDAIYDFIQRDFEDEGYSDAMVNADMSYRVSKEELLRNNLKSRFQQVRLRYNDDIRMLKVKINVAETQMVITTADYLKAQIEMFEDHLKQLDKMEQDLERNDARMTQMIESYKRGFLKGISAKCGVLNEL